MRALPSILLLALLAAPARADLGAATYLLSENGKLITTLNDTWNDQLDLPASLLLRYADGAITAAAFTSPDKILWTYRLDESYHDLFPEFIILPNLYVVVDNKHLCGFDKRTGKTKYRVPFEARTTWQPPGTADIVLLDDSAQRGTSDLPAYDIQHPQSTPKNFAHISKLNLNTGECLWYTALKTPDGNPVLVDHFSTPGVIETVYKQQIYFDPATGKLLAKKPEKSAAITDITDIGHVTPTPSPELERLGKLIDKNLAARLTDAVLFHDRLLIPLDFDHPADNTRSADIVALSPATGKELWRFHVPSISGADDAHVTITPCPAGLLIRLNWHQPG